MAATLPYIRTQAELLADLEALIRDTSNVRFTEVEIYRALNQGLMRWADKVKLLFKYTISGGFTADVNEYTLPTYVRPPIYPEIYLPTTYFESAPVNPSDEWRDLVGWDFQPDGSGTNVLRVYNPRSEEGQVWFYAPNSRVPTTIPTTSGSTSDTATSMTLGSAVDVDDVGLIKCNAEIMAYAIDERNASTTVLTLQQRGLYGTSAATHNTASSVYWCVGADTISLYDQLHNQARAVLAQLPQFDGGTHERAIYQQLMQYYQQLADDYWKMYSPARRVSPIRLNRMAHAFK